MLELSYNCSECCYLEAAKRMLGAADNQELCQKIDVRYSYGQVNAEEYRNHYNPDFWLMRKVSWILSVPFRFIAAVAALAESAIDSLRQNHLSSKINLFCAVRLFEYAAGDFICFFNDQKGQHWTTDAYVHIKLYLLAKQTLDQRQEAFNKWFLQPLEMLHDNLRHINKSMPPLVQYLASLPRK